MTPGFMVQYVKIHISFTCRATSEADHRHVVRNTLPCGVSDESFM